MTDFFSSTYNPCILMFALRIFEDIHFRAEKFNSSYSVVEIHILDTVPIFAQYVSDISCSIRGPFEFFFVLLFLFVLLPSQIILLTIDNKGCMGCRFLD